MPLVFFHWPDQSGYFDKSCACAPHAIPIAATVIEPIKIRKRIPSSILFSFSAV
jgi:hypothetical protein